MITGLPATPIITPAGNVFAATVPADLSVSETSNTVTISPSAGTPAIITAAVSGTAGAAGCLDAPRATIIDNLAAVASSGAYNDLVNAPTRQQILSATIDGNGSAITAPLTRWLYVPFAATITAWTLIADQTGSITIDIWKAPYANFPPTVANTIAAGSPPFLSSQQIAQVTALPAGWTIQINANDILGFHVSSATTVQYVIAELTVTR
jgi:hypothetical protein